MTIHLARELSAGTNRALGLWRGEDLAAVISWKPYGLDYWRVTLLAVDVRFRGMRYAAGLKDALVDRAAEAHVRLIFSSVHRDNHAMVHINTKIGGASEVDPKNIDYLLFVIDVATARERRANPAP